MPVIRPSADLRYNYSEISEFCHKNTEPVFITENGQGDLYQKINQGINDVNEGRYEEASIVINRIKTRLNVFPAAST